MSKDADKPKRDTSSKTRGYAKTDTKGVYKRGNRYVAPYKGADGKQHWVSAETKTKCKKMLAKAKAAADDGKSLHVKRSVRFEVYAAQWLETYNGRADGGIQRTTMINHAKRVDKHLVPRLGHLTMSSIDRKKLMDFKADLLEYRQENGKPLSAKSLRAIIQTLVMILTSAREDGYLAGDPTENANLKISSKTKRMTGADGKPLPAFDVLSPSELARVLKIFDEGDWRWLMLRVLAATGFRIGEAKALTYADLFKNSRGTWVLEVSKAWSDEIHGIKDPKNDYSCRQVPISNALAMAIKRHQLQHKWGEPTDWLFPALTNRKKTITHSAVIGQIFEAVSLEVGRRFTPHGIRHSWVTHRINDAVSGKPGAWDIGLISRLAGHAHVRITMETYMNSGMTDDPKPVDLDGDIDDEQEAAQ